MAEPFNNIDPVRKTYFIKESERNTSDPTQDEGKLVQLESNGLISPAFISSSPTVSVFESSDTWTKPAKLSFIVVEVIGGGGASAGKSGSTGTPSGAGGGGGYARYLIPESDLGDTETVTVGAGGISSSGAADGGNGGTSSFTITNGTDVIANGGAGGKTGGGNNGGAGGDSTGGDVNLKGESARGTSSDFIANGGGSFYGNGGVPNPSTTAFQSGDGYGAGAAGQVSSGGADTVGADGTDGVVIVTEYFL